MFLESTSDNQIISTMNDIMTNVAAKNRLDFDDLHSSSLDKRPEDEHDIEKSSSTVEEILQQVQRELCLIKLCWPDVSIMTEDLYVRSLPNTYRYVSDKERLLLWYAENFRRQFHAKYANRRPMLLACENECRVQIYRIQNTATKNADRINVFLFTCTRPDIPRPRRRYTREDRPHFVTYTGSFFTARPDNLPWCKYIVPRGSSWYGTARPSWAPSTTDVGHLFSNHI
ncbi:hypothetical protein ALC62_05486 [Cyphomyrmex costatus]|uniref:Dynein regulatory complex subunit 7 n=1 Tax=Cyphomyrmex costatus TaxID=456900 RepID=A0A195CSJ3_9HYME|nr:hypothetical protein ALC62_05486 [Cyphomyrmex costatus]